MNLDCVKEKMCVNKLVKKLTKEIILEEDIIIPDSKPDILSYVSSNNNICISKKEISNGNIKIEGTNNIYISYIPDSDVDILRCIDTSINFKKSIDIEELKEDMCVKINCIIKQVECKILNGRKVRIKVLIELYIEIFSNEEIQVLKDINNINNVQSLVKNMNVFNIIIKGTSKTIVKDNIKISNNDDILEVIKVEYKVINKDYKISYNKVLGKADLSVKFVYITQDNNIKESNGTIPIIEFVNMENVNENNKIDMDFIIRNFNIKVNNSDHTIYVESEIELDIIAYENRNVDVIKDIYIPNKDISYVENDIRAITNEKIINKKSEFKKELMLENIKENNIKDINIRYKNLENKILNNNKLKMNGEFEVQILAIDNENKIINNIEKIPYEFEIEISENIYRTNNLDDYNISVEFNNNDVNYKESNDKLEFNINSDFNVRISSIENLKLLDELKLVETKVVRPYSLIIYFVKKGDTLWSIAKKFNTTVDEIVRINNIKDKNTIYPGQKLFILKYIDK